PGLRAHRCEIGEDDGLIEARHRAVADRSDVFEIERAVADRIDAQLLTQHVADADGADKLAFEAHRWDAFAGVHVQRLERVAEAGEPVLNGFIHETEEARIKNDTGCVAMLEADDEVAGEFHLGSRSLKRWSLPVLVLGSSVTNSMARGYLYGAIVA